MVLSSVPDGIHRNIKPVKLDGETVEQPSGLIGGGDRDQPVTGRCPSTGWDAGGEDRQVFGGGDKHPVRRWCWWRVEKGHAGDRIGGRW